MTRALGTVLLKGKELAWELTYGRQQLLILLAAVMLYALVPHHRIDVVQFWLSDSLSVTDVCMYVCMYVCMVIYVRTTAYSLDCHVGAMINRRLYSQ